jgi:hypothetical protein
LANHPGRESKLGSALNTIWLRWQSSPVFGGKQGVALLRNTPARLCFIEEIGQSYACGEYFSH